MERSFYTDELEDLIKEKADQYKMYPSERVWKGIYRTVHRRKWYWFGFAFLLSGLGFYTIYQLATPVLPTTHTESEVRTATTQQSTPAVIIPFKQSGISNDLSANNNINMAEPIAELSNTPSYSTIQGIEKATTPEVEDELLNRFIAQLTEEHQEVAAEEEALIHFETSIPTTGIAAPAEKTPVVVEAVTEITETVAPAVAQENTMLKQPVPLSEEAAKTDWLQQHATYELNQSAPRRLGWQITFTPSTNYRRLTGKDGINIYSIKKVPVSLNPGEDVGNLVNHQPAIGFELGSYLRYALTKDLTLRTGLQFNYSRYEIKAYDTGEDELATLTTNDNSGYVTSYTHLSNFGGVSTVSFQNQYYQLSIPVGLDLRVAGNQKVQFNVAASLQPTYLLNKNTYLITTDYNNYAQAPSLVRRWNLNTGAEAYVSFATGDVKWQIGPQFRYQVLSSYIRTYPIKEHLMEYGIKFGVTKTLH